MPERIEYLDLTVLERQTASRLVAHMGLHLPWERVEAIFRSLQRADWLMVPQHRLQAELPMHTPSLLRNERRWAAAIVLALNVWLGEEESAERVITYLAQRGAALDALLIHEAAVTSQEQRFPRAVL
jgi:hypothetical protein